MAKKTGTSSLNKVYQQAESYEKQQKFAAAIKKYCQALEIEANPGTLGIVAWLELSNKQYREALAPAKKMRAQAIKFRSNPLISIASTLIGLIHHEAGRKVLARRYYEEAISANPRSDTRTFFGVLLNEMDLPKEAREQFQKALQLDLNNAEAHYYIAIHYKKHDNPDLSLRHLQRAIELNPKFVPALMHLATLMWRNGKESVAEARDLLNRAVHLDPENPACRIYLACTCIILDELVAAEVTLQNALADFPKEPYCHWFYGYFLDKYRQDVESAEKSFKKAIKLDPDSQPAHQYYWRMLQRLGQEKGNEEIGKKAEAINN